MFESIYNDYDAGKLTDEERGIISGYTFAIEDAGNREFIIDDMLGLMGDDSIMGKMKAEIASETIDKLLEYLEVQKQDLIISFLDENAVSEEDDDLFEDDDDF